jgi:hypothetical protein
VQCTTLREHSKEQEQDDNKPASRIQGRGDFHLQLAGDLGYGLGYEAEFHAYAYAHAYVRTAITVLHKQTDNRQWPMTFLSFLYFMYATTTTTTTTNEPDDATW